MTLLKSKNENGEFQRTREPIWVPTKAQSLAGTGMGSREGLESGQDPGGFPERVQKLSVLPRSLFLNINNTVHVIIRKLTVIVNTHQNCINRFSYVAIWLCG